MCLLCGEPAATGLGSFLQSIHCHQLCVKFSHGLRVKARNSLPKDVEIVREVKRARKLVCVYCKRRGASVNCQAEDCSRTYHLGCGRGRGVLNRHSDSASFCPAHIPFPPLTAPVPRPPCVICTVAVGTDLLQCPACSAYIDRACLDTRASAGESECPSCADTSAFQELSERFGIWFRNPTAEKELIASGSGAPSPTISYLMRECSSHQTEKGPKLVKNMLSPMNQHLAAQKSTRPFRPVMRSEEPIVRLTATPSPDKGSAQTKRDSDSDVVCVASGGWLSTPGNSLSRKQQGAEPRKTKSLPGKVQPANKSPNQLISTFFKPIAKSPGASESEVEIMEPIGDTSNLETSTKDSSTKTTRACSPVNTLLLSPKKSLSPFKTIRMCTTTTKVVRPVMKIELSTDTGTEGPLSDIDDILSGSIPHLESHPLAEAVFDPSNKHLKEIMKKISESEKEERQIGANENKNLECEAEKKVKEKKTTERKGKPEVERRKVLKKAHQRMQTDSDSSGKGRQRVQIKKLPLTSRQIFHGRNWVPMTEFGKGEEEAECECEWVMDYTRNKLEDFVDLNSGEKTMMNLWNKHGRGVIHLDTVVEDFLTERSHTIVELNLYRNFVAHLSTLHSSNLLSNETMLKCINDMQDVMKVLVETETKVWPVWVDQREQTIELAAAKEAKESAVWQQENSTASPSRIVSSLLDGLANLGSFIARSAGRARLNSNLPGCSSPSHGRSPTCGSPSRLQPASPSRPTSASNSIGRGRRSSNWNKNIQKHLDFDRPQAPMDHFSQIANEETPRKPKIRTPGCPTTNSDSGDTSASEAGQEVASFLTNFPGHLEPPFKEEEDSAFSVHVLTEEPDDDQNSEAEEEEEETIGGTANEEEVEVAEGQRRSSRVASGSEVKNFLRLQTEEFERTVLKAREKDTSGERVPVFYVDDAIIEEVGDNLIVVKPKDERLTALKNVYMKVQEKRKSAPSQGSGPLAKRARLMPR